MRALILSDKRVGHINQSYDFCRYLELDVARVDVSYKFKFLKFFSYVLDKLSLYFKIFHSSQDVKNSFSIIVATGSTTYYPAIYFSKKFNIPAIALMYPSGYDLKNFKYIIASKHDNPPKLQNIIELPANIAHAKKSEIFLPSKKSIAIIIGGNNKVFTMQKDEIEKILLDIKSRFDGYEIAITTSPRTPQKIEKMIKEMDFDFKLIYSEDKRNPIGDFLFLCEEVFLSIDSTSMISQAISTGVANVCIIPLKTENPQNKYQRLANNLVENGYAYFYPHKSKKCKKFDIKQALTKVIL